jgi:hypothetical protein
MEEVRRRFEKIEANLTVVSERQVAADARAAERMKRAEERMERSDARFEKRMRGFEKLAKIGMREMAELRHMHRQFAKRTDDKLNALIDSQQRTEDALRAYIGARTQGNGHSGRRNK